MPKDKPAQTKENVLKFLTQRKLKGEKIVPSAKIAKHFGIDFEDVITMMFGFFPEEGRNPNKEVDYGIADLKESGCQTVWFLV